MDNVIGTGFALSGFALAVSLITLAHSYDHDRDINQLQGRLDIVDLKLLNIELKLDKANCDLAKNLGEVKDGSVYYVSTYKRNVVQVGLNKYGILDENAQWVRMGFKGTLAEVKEYMVKMEYRTSPMECDSGSF